MFRYTLSRSNTALSTTADWVTIIAAAARALKLEEVFLTGMATASAANEVAVARSSGGSTGSGALTAVPEHSSAPAAAFTNFTGWTTQPTIGAVLLRLGVNANGGVIRWVAAPNSQLVIPAGTQISLRSIVGTSSMSGHVIVTEI